MDIFEKNRQNRQFQLMLEPARERLKKYTTGIPNDKPITAACEVKPEASTTKPEAFLIAGL